VKFQVFPSFKVGKLFVDSLLDVACVWRRDCFLQTLDWAYWFLLKGKKEGKAPKKIRERTKLKTLKIK